MFSIFSPYGGYIRSFGIGSFWKGLSLEEQTSIKEAYAKTLYPMTFDTSVIDTKGVKEKADCSLFSFLFGSSVKLYQQKDFSLAEKVLVFASKKIKEPVALHQVYDLLIDVLYKQRDENTNAIKKCIDVCKKDIKLAPIIKEEKNEIPSFKRLAIILESQGDYKGAIEVSNQALKYGLGDGTKGGFEGRIAKLKTKI